MHYASLAVAALMGVARAVDVQVVAVGMNPDSNTTDIKFWPDKITAEPGTMVQFQFWAGNHTVTQSNFDNPCMPISDIDPSVQGVYSGFQPVDASANMGMIPVYTIMVNDTKPMWMFCSKGKHCQGGMSMVINENTSANETRSLENYKAAAESATASEVVPGSGTSTGGTGGSTDGESGSGSGSDSGSGSGSGSDSGSGSGSGGDSAVPTTIQTAVPTAGTNGSSTGGDAAQATETPIAAGGSSIFVPSTLLLCIGAAFMLF